MNVTFCGHSQVCDRERVRAWLVRVVRALIEEGADVFYLGGYGEFDRMAASVLGQLKDQYPHIQRILVLAYLNRKQDLTGYDDTTYPPLESVPPRYAIVRRNRWMVETADLVIGYVTHDGGGAAGTLRYAGRKKKQILCYPEIPEEKLTEPLISGADG